MIINIYLDDLKDDKRLEVIFALREDATDWVNKPIFTLMIDEEAEF